MKYKRVKLGEIADIAMGQSPKSQYYNNEGNGKPFLQGIRTFGENYPIIDTFTTKYKKLSKKGDILFSVRAPVGTVNWSEKEIAIGRGIAAITIHDNYDPDCVYYYFKKYGNLFDKVATGTVFTSINKSELSDLELNIPDSIYDQRKIGCKLKMIDNKIELNKRINDNNPALFVSLKAPHERLVG